MVTVLFFAEKKKTEKDDRERRKKGKRKDGKGGVRKYKEGRKERKMEREGEGNIQRRREGDGKTGSYLCQGGGTALQYPPPSSWPGSQQAMQGSGHRAVAEPRQESRMSP